MPPDHPGMLKRMHLAAEYMKKVLHPTFADYYQVSARRHDHESLGDMMPKQSIMPRSFSPSAAALSCCRRSSQHLRPTSPASRSQAKCTDPAHGSRTLRFKLNKYCWRLWQSLTEPAPLPRLTPGVGPKQPRCPHDNSKSSLTQLH